MELRLPPKRILWLLISLLLLGIFFRFVNIDRKVYWHDEVYTSLRINGYNGDRAVEELFNGQVITTEEVLRFQRPSPDKGFGDALARLIEHPEHPPLYYAIAHFWTRIFGGSIAATRSLSAVISLFVFPALYWLCWELFQHPTVGWYAVALMSVSPFYVLYAQEARQYSLWTLVTLIASTSLLRAIRLQTWKNWVLYGCAIALNFYTFLLSIWFAFSCTIYVLAIERFRLTKISIRFFLSSFSGLLLFSPWLFVIFRNYVQFQDKTAWTKTKEPLTFLSTLWGLHLNSVFVDLGFDLYSIFSYIFTFIFIILLGYAIFLLYCHTPRKIWWFVIPLIALPALGLILPDLLRGGRASSASRYFIPAYIGIQIAIAHLFSTKIQSSKNIERKTWSILFAILISLGITSCSIVSSKYTWWNKVISYHNAEIAEIINQTERPLVVSDDYEINTGNLISLTHKLDPKVKLLFVKRPNLPQIPQQFNPIFLYNPSPELLKALQTEKKFAIELVPDRGYPIWKLTPISHSTLERRRHFTNS
ncbi:glycosyltransferase family 39 protein [Lusitaniella coriacea LEGE 07157]|uniref:Glycosyltransferase family 39 protein n=1 Tax=Lusitaniella coriacea LEGE 07157 TaxID=945747 RepID=A0A8J7JFJ7_9CYAN|nr:glycosyltransferase family 39 protein [Lusitaniella coriacea]MBE9118815.1 glycosyltransferase family 39 protein [Lusitaniella coriacea LEGE 07157]